ncbi:hypothetical protein KKG56_07465 [bacterium]|nr:hypothetical protein [bacterium]
MSDDTVGVTPCGCPLKPLISISKEQSFGQTRRSAPTSPTIASGIHVSGVLSP